MYVYAYNVRFIVLASLVHSNIDLILKLVNGVSL